MAKYGIHIWSSSQGFWETGENDIYPRGTRNKGQILSETGYKDNIGELNVEHNKTIFDSWGTGKQAYLFQGDNEMAIPLGGSNKRSNFQTNHQFVCLFIRLSTRPIKLCL